MSKRDELVRMFVALFLLGLAPLTTSMVRGSAEFALKNPTVPHIWEWLRMLSILAAFAIGAWGANGYPKDDEVSTVFVGIFVASLIFGFQLGGFWVLYCGILTAVFLLMILSIVVNRAPAKKTEETDKK